MPSPSYRSALPWLLGAWVLGLGSTAAVVRSVMPAAPLAERAGYQQAVGALQASANASTLVLVWPPHLADPGSVAPGLSVSDAVPTRASRFATIAVLLPQGEALPVELEGLPATRATFGAVDVARVNLPGSAARYDLLHHVGALRVALDAPALACNVPHPEGGFACPGRPPWNRAGPAELQVSGQAWPCLWAHPVQGRTLRIDVPPTEATGTLVLEAALSDAAVATADGAAVTLTLLAAGTTRRLHVPNAPGRRRLELLWDDDKARSPWTIEVTTPRDGRRHLGITARVLP